jgi:hypothetical protein
LATSASDNLLNFFGGELKLKDWCKGIYFCGPLGFRTAIVALNRLPATPDTLLLRLLGKGQTQLKAIEEVRALKPDNPLRDQVEYLLFRWHICVKTQDELSQDEKELLMNTSEMVEEYQQKIFQQGMQRFQEIGGKLLARFGTIDDALWQVIDPLLKLPPKESSQLIQQSSREELLAKLGH